MSIPKIVSIITVLALLSAIPFFMGKKEPASPGSKDLAPISGSPVSEFARELERLEVGDSVEQAPVKAIVPVQSAPVLESAPVISESITPTTPKTVAVDIQSFAFGPKELTIKRGTTVVFTDKDGVPHTVTSDVVSGSGGLNSGHLAQGGTYQFVFDKIGTYRYHCEYHPSMKATITVTE